MHSDPGAITLLLDHWSRGDPDAFPRLMAVAYDDLRAIAHRRLRAGLHDDLATTALVHEVYLRLLRHDGGSWERRAQFYAFASQAMRSILVDHARKVNAKRRGSGEVPLDLSEEIIASASDDLAVEEVIVVDEALERLAELHPRMARVVELRFFGGLVVEEVAKVLDTSVRTVEREWTRARAYLLNELCGHDD
jgi:RNA polymerase sigma factor (TIGR02999 family)